ncbi:hypothetical protein [Rhodoferax sp.]|uniref:hypothetical protein n=1 Tax=Rhodoferax sp. TaxID=50421 RepID=UPI0027672128|nr:hypothetical protein [Rhodoferax sp.]
MAHEPLIFFHLKLVAKVGVAVSVLALAALMVALMSITGEAGASYDAIIRARSLTRENLAMAMLIAGLVLVAITGLITWLIVLYSSFRVAGPLYRFSQNLRLASADDATALIELRKGDALFAQAATIQRAVAAWRAHHLAHQRALDLAARALAAGDAAQYADAMAQLKTLDDKVRL